MANDNAEGSCDALLERLSSHVASTPDKIACTFISSDGKIEKQVTYRQLAAQTDRAAAALISQHNIQPGDRAVLVYPPSLDFMLAFIACLKAGVVAVPCFPPNPLRRETLRQFCQIVAGCGATVALTNTTYNHAKTLSQVKDKMNFRKGAIAPWPEELRWIVTDSMWTDKGKGASRPSVPPVTPTSAAFLQYTSGSTSAPKGVIVTYGNLAHNLTLITTALRADASTVVVSWLPQYHDMGLIGSYLGILYCGGSGIYTSPVSFVQRPMLWMELVSKYKGTHLQGPNFCYKLTARKYREASKKVASLDLSSVRHIINAAEPVDETSIAVFEETFGPHGLKKGVLFPTYGLAEHTVMVCTNGKQRLQIDKEVLETEGAIKIVKENGTVLLGCGVPPTSVDLRIVKEDGKEVAEDSVGEIWLSSSSKAAGYYRQPEESASDFEATLEGSDAQYLRTGDLGFLHNGEVFICGRLKDLIIVGGRNYYPQDIEATAEAVGGDKVRLGCSAAFSVDPTCEGNEEVALVMELKESKTPTQTCLELCNEIRSVVNKEHSLALIEIVLLGPRTVPKTHSGKIARAWCRKGYRAQTLKVVYRKIFKSTPGATQGTSTTPLEIETPATNGNGAKYRSWSKEEIRKKLVADLCRVASVSPADIDDNTAVVGMMDSLTLSQFKGLLENNYAIRSLSDEYLFRETCTVSKLVEVIKLGQAPDDVENGSPSPSPDTPSGNAGGLAGALGCPPGVVCTIL